MFKLKDIIIIGSVLVLLSPVIYFVMLLLTNSARIEFGKPDNSKASVSEELVKTIKSSPAKDSMVAKYSRSYQAYEIQRREIADQEARIADERNRLEILKSEIEKEKNALAGERSKMESLVSQNDSIEIKKVRQLAKVYGAMRSTEAARILETLDNNLVAKILTNITDAGIKAKILQSLSAEKAKSVTTRMGR
jgi:flagellar motility protein MotE (MotC chaperone)